MVERLVVTRGQPRTASSSFYTAGETYYWYDCQLNEAKLIHTRRRMRRDCDGFGHTPPSPDISTVSLLSLYLKQGTGTFLDFSLRDKSMESSAHKVLRDSAVLRHIVAFLPGLPHALLVFEVEAYASQTWKKSEFPSHCRDQGTFLFYHAVLQDNTRVCELLMRLQRHPYYVTRLPFSSDKVLELICKRGNVKHLALLHAQPGISTAWPRYLLTTTLQGILAPQLGGCPKDEEQYRREQEHKAEWLIAHHPEATTVPTKPWSSLLANRAFFEKLLRAGRLDMSDFAETDSQYLDIALLKLLLDESPGVATSKFVHGCARSGNLEVIMYLQEHATELPTGIFTPAAMDAAAGRGHLDLVRYLHENRSEGCTATAMRLASSGGHLDVVQFLNENVPQVRTQLVMNAAIREACHVGGHKAIVQFLVTHHTGALEDPTSWDFNDTVSVVRSAWAETAATSGDPVDALRAAVIRLTVVDEFEKVHGDKHPVACKAPSGTFERSLLHLAITEGKVEFAKLLVQNCQHARASISFTELMAAGFDFDRPNLELVELLVTNGLKGFDDRWQVTDFHQKAAENGEFEVVKLTSLPCCSCDADVLTAVLGSSATTWEQVRLMYEHRRRIQLTDAIARRVWAVENDELLVFMWLAAKTVSVSTRDFAHACLRCLAGCLASCPGAANFVSCVSSWIPENSRQEMWRGHACLGWNHAPSSEGSRERRVRVGHCSGGLVCRLRSSCSHPVVTPYRSMQYGVQVAASCVLSEGVWSSFFAMSYGFLFHAQTLQFELSDGQTDPRPLEGGDRVYWLTSSFIFLLSYLPGDNSTLSEIASPYFRLKSAMSAMASSSRQKYSDRSM